MGDVQLGVDLSEAQEGTGGLCLCPAGMALSRDEKCFHRQLWEGLLERVTEYPG